MYLTRSACGAYTYNKGVTSYSMVSLHEVVNRYPWVILLTYVKRVIRNKYNTCITYCDIRHIFSMQYCHWDGCYAYITITNIYRKGKVHTLRNCVDQEYSSLFVSSTTRHVR